MVFFTRASKRSPHSVNRRRFPPSGHTYDAAGRLSVRDLGNQVSQTCSGDPNSTDYPFEQTYHYDGDNHTIYNGTDNGIYGPDGQPFSLQAGGVVYSLHYDGTQLLFVTTSGGALSGVNFETLGEGTPNGPGVLDRDMGDTAVASHAASGYSGVYLGSITFPGFLGALSGDPNPPQTAPYYFNGSAPSNCAQPNSCAIGPVATFTYVRTDGFGWGDLTIQGARSMDASTGQWTTPDAYAGDVHDPMTQKAFMWNRNNPYEYSDPTGYDPIERELENALLGAETASMRALLVRQLNQVRSGKDLDSILKRIAPRPHDRIPGGTAGAVRNELKTGKPTAGKFHVQKGAEEIGNLDEWIAQNGSIASKEQLDAAKKALKDLKDAFGDTDPKQFINNNRLPSALKN